MQDSGFRALNSSTLGFRLRAEDLLGLKDISQRFGFLILEFLTDEVGVLQVKTQDCIVVVYVEITTSCK